MTVYKKGSKEADEAMEAARRIKEDKRIMREAAAKSKTKYGNK
jgi:hypothetical protein